MRVSSRRKFIQALLSITVAGTWTNQSLANIKTSTFSKLIPSSDKLLPAIGMGTWITFDHKPHADKLIKYIEILNAFFTAGGRLIDSSPMYGYAQQMLGAVLPEANKTNALFSATKVWVPGEQFGIDQMTQSFETWGLRSMDLMQIHNMLDWQTHLPVLNQWKKEGKIKYTGITTSHGRRHKELITMLKKHPVDFVQFTYNIHDREVEKYLLPLAQDMGVAVIINRPFQTGGLFNRIKGQNLPDWAAAIGCKTWAQFFLKFIVSHPAVTCAIPATSQVKHMEENMLALNGNMPDQAMRNEMVNYFNTVS